MLLLLPKQIMLLSIHGCVVYGTVYLPIGNEKYFDLYSIKVCMLLFTPMLNLTTIIAEAV